MSKHKDMNPGTTAEIISIVSDRIHMHDYYNRLLNEHIDKGEYNQTQIADAIGTWPATVNRWATGKCRLTRKNMRERLARLFDDDRFILPPRHAIVNPVTREKRILKIQEFIINADDATLDKIEDYVNLLKERKLQ